MTFRVALTFDAEHPDRPPSRRRRPSGSSTGSPTRGHPRDVLHPGSLGRGLSGAGPADRGAAATSSGTTPTTMPGCRCSSTTGLGDRRPSRRAGDRRRDRRRPAPMVPLPVRGRRGRPGRAGRSGEPRLPRDRLGRRGAGLAARPRRTRRWPRCVADAAIAHGDGAVILLHPWIGRLSRRSPRLIDRLAAAGAMFVRIDELRPPPRPLRCSREDDPRRRRRELEDRRRPGRRGRPAARRGPRADHSHQAVGTGDRDDAPGRARGPGAVRGRDRSLRPGRWTSGVLGRRRHAARRAGLTQALAAGGFAGRTCFATTRIGAPCGPARTGLGRHRHLRCRGQRGRRRTGRPERPPRCARRHLGRLGRRHGRRLGRARRARSGPGTAVVPPTALERRASVLRRADAGGPDRGVLRGPHRRRRASPSCRRSCSPRPEAGDAVARTIVDRLADEVVAMAGAMMRRLHLTRTDPDVVLGGGVFRTDEPRFYERIAAGVAEIAPAARIVRLSAPPVAGAALLGLDTFAGRTVPPKVSSAVRAAIGSWDADVQRSASGPRAASSRPSSARSGKPA